jgi:hypothetical protein
MRNASRISETFDRREYEVEARGKRIKPRNSLLETLGRSVIVNKMLLERRTEMLRQSLTGAPLRLIIEGLKDKYGVNEKRLYADWERRGKWVSQIVQLQDPTLLHQFLEGARQVLPRAWQIALNADDDFAKLRALTLIKDTNLSMLKILQSIGIIEQKPVQVDQRVLAIKGQWWHAGFEADPDLKRALMEEAERQRREHDEHHDEEPSVSPEKAI